MNVSLIDPITTASGPQTLSPSPDSQSGIFAGLLLASGAANTTGESESPADPLAQLADLLGAPIVAGVTPPPSQSNPALTASPGTTAPESPASNNGPAETALPPAGSAAAPSAAAQNHIASGEQVLPREGTNAPANGGNLPGPSLTAAAGPGPADGAPPNTSLLPQQSGGTAGRPAGQETKVASVDPASPDAEPAPTKPLSANITSAKTSAAQESILPGPSAKAATSATGTSAGSGAQPQKTAGGSSARIEVTVSQATGPSQAAAPIAPETAAAILTVHEQTHIAAQTSVPPNGAASVGVQTAGQITREDRRRIQSLPPQATTATTPHATNTGARARSLVQAGAAAAAASGPRPTGPAERSTLALPGDLGAATPAPTAGAASLAAPLTAPPGDLISSTGLQSESERSQWRPTAPADQVAVHIKKAIGEGKDKITVRLEPAELGRIEVKLAASSDGAIRATIMADRPETLDLLQNDSRVLERALQDAGLKTNNDSLSFNLRGEGQNGKFAEQGEGGKSTETADQGLSDETMQSADSPNNRSRHDGTVDISV